MDYFQYFNRIKEANKEIVKLFYAEKINEILLTISIVCLAFGLPSLEIKIISINATLCFFFIFIYFIILEPIKMYAEDILCQIKTEMLHEKQDEKIRKEIYK